MNIDFNCVIHILGNQKWLQDKSFSNSLVLTVVSPIKHQIYFWHDIAVICNKINYNFKPLAMETKTQYFLKFSSEIYQSKKGSFQCENINMFTSWYTSIFLTGNTEITTTVETQ